MKMSSRRLLYISIAWLASAVVSLATGAGAAELYGPENLLRTMKTPFSVQQEAANGGALALAPLSLQQPAAPLHSLSHRLLGARLYLPGRMVIGSTAEFIIKGKPGCWAALAMADRNSGAKPIYGHEIHLGPDRKVVSLGRIPEAGVLSLIIDTPIQGDLIGQPLYFEAALWTRDDFSDMEIATPVPSESTATKPGERNNGVLMAGEPDHRKGFRIVPDGMVPMQQLQGQTGIDSGRP